jgi:hypothetical protein
VEGRLLRSDDLAGQRLCPKLADFAPASQNVGHAGSPAKQAAFFKVPADLFT